MDPASILGITTASVTLLRLLIKASFGLETQFREFRSVGETIEALLAELAAFSTILRIFEDEIGRNHALAVVGRWWEQSEFEALLRNMESTLNSLNAIAQILSKERSRIADVRRFHRSKSYDREIQSLRLRLSTYVKALDIAITYAKLNDASRHISLSQQLDDEDASDANLQPLSTGINQLNSSISTLETDTRRLVDEPDQDEIPDLRQGSQQLINLTRALTNSVQGSIRSASTYVTARPLVQPLPTVTEYSPSVHGVPLSEEARNRLDQWASSVSDSASELDQLSAAFDLVTLEAIETSAGPSAEDSSRAQNDLRAALAEQRLVLISARMSQGSYKEAVPLLRLVIQRLESGLDGYAGRVRLPHMQLLLAKAIIKSEESRHEVEGLLNTVINQDDGNNAEISSALYLLALLCSEKTPPQLERAKELGVRAAELEVRHRGRDDPGAQRYIALVVAIRDQLDDPESGVWRGMLPDDYVIPLICTKSSTSSSSTISAKPDESVPTASLSVVSSTPNDIRPSSILSVAPSDITLQTTFTEHTNWIMSVAFSPSCQLLASGSLDGTVKLWNVVSKSSTPQRTIEVGSPTPAVAISPDGQLLASGLRDGMIHLWHMGSGKLQRTLQGHKSTVRSMAFSPDGQTLISGSYDTSIKLWDVSSGELQRTLVKEKWSLVSRSTKLTAGSVLAVSISPDGRLIASGMYGGSIKLWNSNSGMLQRDIKSSGSAVYLVAFSPDSHLLASGFNDKLVVLRDVATGSKRLKLTGHEGTVISVSFSPDGQLLASGSTDNTIKLWHVGSGKLHKTLEGHTSTVQSVAFSSDGRLLASGSHDKTVKLWSIPQDS